MKRTFSLVFIFLVIIFVIYFMKFKTMLNKNFEIFSFNSEYEAFKAERINGLDVASVIHKASSNNEKYNVSKDKDGYYNLDDSDCIEIYVIMIVDDNGKAKKYRMESINKAGMNNFISSFGEAYFNCTDTNYYDTGKIKSMTFELLD